MGHFVGSSTGHLGILWIEAGLAQSDLVCGLVHEFVHLALNLADMAMGVFSGAAYDGSVLALSPLLKLPRPYAMSMHALMVQSALSHLHLRMSTDPPGEFDFEQAAAGLDASAEQALTEQGRALFEAARVHAQGKAEPHPLRLQEGPDAVERYLAQHASPKLLFWGGTQRNNDLFELCFEVSDVGAVVFDGVRMVEHDSDSEYEGWRKTEREALDAAGKSEKTSFEAHRMLRSGHRRPPLGGGPGSIFELGTLTVDDPWAAKYADIAACFDCLDVVQWGRYTQRLQLPCGLGHKEAKADPELTVAAACDLPPLRIVTVLPEPADDALRLVCLGAVSGDRLGDVVVPAADVTAFGAVRGELAKACSMPPASVRFLTAAGATLGAGQQDTAVASLFGPSPEPGGLAPP